MFNIEPEYNMDSWLEERYESLSDSADGELDWSDWFDSPDAEEYDDWAPVNHYGVDDE